MKKGKRILALAMAAVLLAAGAAGCAKPKTQTITLAVDSSIPPALLSGIYTAIETKLYSAGRIKVEFRTAKGMTAAQMAAKGEAQFAVTQQEELGKLWSQDTPAPLTAVSALTYQDILGLLSDKKAGINTLKKMEGKRCAYTGTETQIAIMKAAMRFKDWNPEKVDFATAPVTDAAAALKDAQGVIVSRGWTNVNAYHSGVDNTIINFYKMNPALTFYGPVLAANSDFLKQNKELARTFVHATSAGYEYTALYPDETYAHLKKHQDTTDNGILKDSHNQYCSLFRKKIKEESYAAWGYIDTDQWNALFDFMYQNKLLKKPLTDFGFTNDYLK